MNITLEDYNSLDNIPDKGKWHLYSLSTKKQKLHRIQRCYEP
jgi:hypothetical protein